MTHLVKIENGSEGIFFHGYGYGVKEKEQRE